jgi:hypothetical protein
MWQQADTRCMVTISGICKEGSRVVVLEGFWGSLLVEELLGVGYGIPTGGEMIVRCGALLAKAKATLAEARVAAGDPVYVFVGVSGGMPLNFEESPDIPGIFAEEAAGLEQQLELLLERLSRHVTEIEEAALRLGLLERTGLYFQSFNRSCQHRS